MNFYTLSLFPNLINDSLKEGIIKNAIKNKHIKLYNYDLREFGVGKHKQLDDTSYGGGPGMILKPEPIFEAVQHIKHSNNITKNKKKMRIHLKNLSKKHQLKK